MSLPFNYLAIDGPIGAGKTTLATMLAKRFEGVKMLESVENPFLPAFYEDAPGSAFQTEIFFLLTRFRQQQELAQRGLFDQLLIADYTFPKNRIFAYLNLSDDELPLFDKVYLALEPQVPVPDLILYLVSDLETCMKRINKRQRSFERGMSEEYISELIDAYHHYYHHYTSSPVLVVDTRNLDFLERPEDFEDLVRQLERPVHGTQYYVPLGNR